ncbi:MAG: helix-turn-helix domain-containing protein [Acidimicrobiales bacterium]
MSPQLKHAWRVEFGQRVRTARHDLGWTQEHLAEESGLHPTYVGDSERGERNVSLDNILRLAKALDTDAGVLMDGLQELL